MTPLLDSLCAARLLGPFLEALRDRYGTYDLLEHWTQGEFHHDVVIRVPSAAASSLAPVVVVATNCNGGIKEVLCFDAMPDRWALWHHRCPDNPEFEGDLPALRAVYRTEHWFDPCELLAADARSELKPEFRCRARGGGWVRKTDERAT